jgi:hypothetical protein
MEARSAAIRDRRSRITLSLHSPSKSIRTFTPVFAGYVVNALMRATGVPSGHDQGHFTSGGSEERIDSTLPPVLSPKMVPRS